VAYFGQYLRTGIFLEPFEELLHSRKEFCSVVMPTKN
jgi:hypothetical protein